MNLGKVLYCILPSWIRELIRKARFSLFLDSYWRSEESMLIFLANIHRRAIACMNVLGFIYLDHLLQHENRYFPVLETGTYVVILPHS